MNIEENVLEEIIELVGFWQAGYTNTQIAAKLCLSVGTVKNYVSSIYDKTGNRERTDIIWYGSLARLFRLDWYIGDNIGMAVRGNGIVFKQWRTVSQVRAVFMKEILQWLEKFTKTN